MNSLETSPQDLRPLLQRASGMAADYWESLPQRPSYPVTSGAKLKQLFEQPIPERGRAAAAFDDFAAIADNIRPGNGRFFGYVLGSGEPVAAIADLLASALNQNL